MEIQNDKKILAVITTNMALVAGGAPIFQGSNKQECENIARSLSRTLDAMTHSLGDGVYIIVSH